MLLSVFAISTNLPGRGHMIDLLANLAFNLKPKAFQKPTQDVPKSMKKGTENLMQVVLILDPSWDDSLWIFGAKLGGKLDPSWHQNLEKKGSQDDVKNMTQKWFKKIHAEGPDRKKPMRAALPVVP